MVRERIILNLMALEMEIDVFGYCVGNPLPGAWIHLPKQLKAYKFYLSFENALHCRDYITEQVWWNALRSGVVPVIWGPRRSDVEELLPKNSFVFVEDFKNEKDLMQYLIELNENDKKYLEFFKWRLEKAPDDIPKRNKFGQPWIEPNSFAWCQLCELLHEDENHEQQLGTRAQRIVKSVHDWWYLEETRTCLASYTDQEQEYSFELRSRLKRQVRYRSWSGKRQFLFVFGSIIIFSIILLRRLKLLFAKKRLY